MGTEFKHLVLDVEDVERSIRFYRDVVGLSLKAREEWNRHHVAVLGLGDFELMLLQQPDPSGTSSRGAGLLLQFQVRSVEETYEAFKKLGVPIAYELHTSSWGGRAFVGADPDGYRVMLAESSPAGARR